MSDDLRICGLAAVRARFAHDARSIQRLYFDYATGRRIGVMCKALAAAKRIYRCVETGELEKIAGTVHHGGIVAVVPAPVLPVVDEADALRWAGKRTPLLLLDRIGNPHNLGAIARAAGFFGVTQLVLSELQNSAVPNDAAYRVAEGAFESLRVCRARDLAGLARALGHAGYDVVGATTHGRRAVLAGAPGAARAVALVLGNEEDGLALSVATSCTRLVTIPGSGAVESLNVASAGAVLLWELFGRGRARATSR